MTAIDLRYDVNAICLAEKLLDKKSVEIISELEAADGVSLRTLRALIAVGLIWQNPLAKVHEAVTWLGDSGLGLVDERGAGKLIEEIGIPAASAVVGAKLGLFFRQLSAKRSAA
jgi:hypothetical protein